MANESLGKGAEQESYVFGYGAAADEFATRAASEHAAFIIPYLKPGMSLLDCGSGPGTITVDLANLVAPGEVVGVDIGESQAERANSLAKERNIKNVRFEVASAYELPFPDESFDVVFSHNMLEHLSEPKKAISEFKRVLKTGGLVGLRSTVHLKDIIEPRDPSVVKMFALIQQLYSGNGQDPFIGGKFRGLLNEFGFSGIEAGASYSSHWTTENISSFVEAGSALWERLLEHGLTDRAEIDELVSDMKKWAQHPDAFLARARGHVVGWKI